MDTKLFKKKESLTPAHPRKSGGAEGQMEKKGGRRGTTQPESADASCYPARQNPAHPRKRGRGGREGQKEKKGGRRGMTQPESADASCYPARQNPAHHPRQREEEEKRHWGGSRTLLLRKKKQPQSCHCVCTLKIPTIPTIVDNPQNRDAGINCPPLLTQHPSGPSVRVVHHGLATSRPQCGVVPRPRSLI